VVDEARGSAGDDGTDELVLVEFLRFDDETVVLSGNVG
jgi:hypothetical protein